MYVIWELAHLLTKFILTLIIKKAKKTYLTFEDMIYIIVNTPLLGPYVLATKKWEWENTCITIHNNITLQKFRTKDFTQFECEENSAVKKLTQLKVFCCLYQKISPQSFSNSFEHLNTCHKPQSSIINQIYVCFKGLSTYICVELYKVTVN